MEVVSIAEIFRMSERKYQLDERFRLHADRRQLKTIAKETETKAKGR